MNSRSNRQVHPGAARLATKTAWFALLLAGIPTLQAVTIESEVRDLAGKPVSGLLIHARPGAENAASPAQTRTDAAGRFRFVLPDGDWQVQVSDNLIDWKPLRTVSLTDSPITLHPNIPAATVHYFRAVSAEESSIPSP